MWYSELVSPFILYQLIFQSAETWGQLIERRKFLNSTIPYGIYLKIFEREPVKEFRFEKYLCL